MSGKRTGECQAIRNYLMQHDGATVPVIAAALNLSIRDIGKACQRMAADGRLERERQQPGFRGATVYRLGRLPDPARKPPRGKVLEIKAAQPVARAAVPGTTSADYPDHLIERLPSVELPWTRYPRPGWGG